ncbi:hypothetical protein SUGI_0468060 [Cryptomeria japonica]|nr:hypothetical protein SUGI_0468060 [Cryptomeria japonica]
MQYHCASGRQCVGWVKKYLRDCVCGTRDYVSVVFGLISLFSWAVAEVPQIITNFKNGSTEGVSLGFLMTWVVGDLFNLIGCWLEPATLPTQLYTALLYTITTIALVCQIIYYDHICKWWKARKAKAQSKIQPKEVFKSEQNDNKKAEPLKVPEGMIYSSESAAKINSDLNKPFSGTPVSSLPIPTISSLERPNTVRDLYYTSARSLASSHTPTPGSYLVHSRESYRSGPSYIFNQSSLDEEEVLTNLISPSPKHAKSILRSVASTIFFIGGMDYFKLPSLNNVTSIPYSSQSQRRSVVIITGRKLLEGMGGSAVASSMIEEDASNHLGIWLGWLMAAIYMGGRLPQISLNITRGTVEGLNPLMFLFALIGNAAYVASIIVRTLEWEKLKPNMPWLVDAGVCVLLDFFILAQFVYYKVGNTNEDESGDYEAVHKDAAA